MSLLHIAGGATEDKLYPEDVFATYLYTGNGSTQTINNGIDLAGKGGLVWCKDRGNSVNNILHDTVSLKHLSSNTTAGGTNTGTDETYNTGGWTINGGLGGENVFGNTYASWTFRKAPKFFDVVTYTGNGVAGRQIPHSLGCEVGMVIVKSSDNANGASQQWQVWHRSRVGEIGLLNTTGEFFSSSNFGEHTTAYFVTATSGTNNNVNGTTYVAYLFAHDPSADGIIQCGSFTTDASGNATVNLGWEPQYLMVKRSGSTGDWLILDKMRGWPVGSNNQGLFPNTSGAEVASGSGNPIATGFYYIDAASQTNIYLAIRRPMKVPTSGTQVFAIDNSSAPSIGYVHTTTFPADLVFGRYSTSSESNFILDRLRGFSNQSAASTAGAPLITSSTSAENTASHNHIIYDVWNNSYKDGGYVVGYANYLRYFLKRAKGFFDVVCYTGTGVARTVNHNLGVVPELMIVKNRTDSSNWIVYHQALSAGGFAYFNMTNAALFSGNTTLWNSTLPTSTLFSLGNSTTVNTTSNNYVTYLFATLPNVSKVGSYTGNGSSQTINCGFSAGARFVLCKRTDDAGDWYLWDTARGIVAANDPHLSLNTTAVEVTTDDSVDPEASGFIVNQNTATNINVNGASYIFLAIA